MHTHSTISRELLKQVTTYQHDVSNIVEDGDYITFNVGDRLIMASINKYELAHMVKEWALPIVGWLDSNLTNAIPSEAGTASFMFNDAEIHRFFAPTEPEAIFKAGEWILEQTKQVKNKD